MISNYPISVADTSNVEKIYGTYMASIKGNSKSSNPSPVIKDGIRIPSKIYKNNSNIELWIDIIYIYGVSFMVSIEIQVKYRSIMNITSQNEKVFSKVLTK